MFPRIGLYDLLSYTIPGVIYLIATVYTIELFFPEKISIKLFNLSISQIIALGILSYVTTFLMDPIAKQWHKIFVSKNLKSETIQKVTNLHNKKIAIEFKAQEWPILLAFIKRENMEVAVDIERFNVIHIMLRNISFGILILGLIQIVVFFLKSYSMVNGFVAGLCIFFSLIAVFESKKYSKWFFSMIFEATAARTCSINEYFGIKS